MLHKKVQTTGNAKKTDARLDFARFLGVMKPKLTKIRIYGSLVFIDDLTPDKSSRMNAEVYWTRGQMLRN